MADNLSNLTKRDKDILVTLYHNRTLTINQIYRMFFPRSLEYCYSRLKKLEKVFGVINGKVLKAPLGSRDNPAGTGIEAKCYVLTEKGIRLAEKSQGLPQTRQACYNAPSDQSKLRLQTKINDVLVAVVEHGLSQELEWIDSRTLKEQYSLSRNLYLAGAVAKRGKDPNLLWYLPEHSTERAITNIFNQVSTVADEGRHQNIAVLCETTDVWKNAIKHYKSLPSHSQPILNRLSIIHAKDVPYLLWHESDRMKQVLEEELEQDLTSAEYGERRFRYTTKEGKKIAELFISDVRHVRQINHYVVQPGYEDDLIVCYCNPDYLEVLDQPVLDKLELRFVGFRPQPLLEPVVYEREWKRNRRVSFTIPEEVYSKLQKEVENRGLDTVEEFIKEMIERKTVEI
ncbi:replication-relaxation family protein [Heliorestis convoluta]|uniref:Replication-relaxation family protein, putative n=1 Tax=Heliorestis convoluta TaxID=356322 RepID=A0A5Q2MWI8_9FIRM|nr:replication-relaxation family protein [Heliorestis convoluta]QGG46864.1 replication-relaxation family protein, putative [Heliorestis convoluta]